MITMLPDAGRLGRATCLAALSLAGLCLAFPAAAQPADPAQGPAAPVLLGVAAPLSDSQAILGQQLVAGARAAAGTTEGDAAIEIVDADTRCSSEGGRQAAETFVAMDAAAVVGFLCAEAIEAALPVLTEAGIPVIDVGVRANRLTDRRERTGHLVWRIAPRSDAQAAAIAGEIARRWQGEPLGLVDDGSIAARGLADAVRRLLGDQGIEPQSVDNYRPAEEKQFGLVRRLERTGITRFFIAGDRPDVAIIMRDAAASGLSLQVIGGEELLDETSIDAPLPEGVIAVAPRSSFPELAAAATDEGGLLPPQGYFGTAYAATEIALTAARRAAATDRPLAEILGADSFATALGEIGFDDKGDSDLDLYRVFEWRGDRFAEAGEG
ncbi:branched-chain amino acid ABC transporter substrate-binding protein [Aurantimonas sp. A2-1-M11]|uniref:branched-chain amino acid ABC transporter substrate-binding protein n=1 Tax=Aurantimonas sp. A2-1-M11 TaxID=3113712 RepID=UPI002F929556